MTTPILDVIQDKELVRNHYGNLVELDEWCHDIARELAAAEGIVLSDEHFEVLDFLRDYAINHSGIKQDAQRVLRRVEDHFREKGGGRWLYTLFPGGPVRQGMKLCRLPEAPRAADPSFGSVS